MATNKHWLFDTFSKCNVDARHYKRMQPSYIALTLYLNISFFFSLINVLTGDGVTIAKYFTLLLRPDAKEEEANLCILITFCASWRPRNSRVRT